MSSFHFTVRITSKFFLWDVHCAPERELTNFRQCPLSDIVRCSAGAAQSYKYGSGAPY